MTSLAPPINPWVYRFVIFVTGVPLWFGGRLKVEGRGNIFPSGRLILAGNHATNLDPFVMARALPKGRRVQFMTKKELFANPLYAYLILAGGSFPVDRTRNDVGAIRTALRILQAEGVLGIFPQGTRGGATLQDGAALIALKAQAPVLPVHIARFGRAWTVRFGTPIPPQGSVRELTARIGEAIGALGIGALGIGALGQAD